MWGFRKYCSSIDCCFWLVHSELMKFVARTKTGQCCQQNRGSSGHGSGPTIILSGFMGMKAGSQLNYPRMTNENNPDILFAMLTSQHKHQTNSFSWIFCTVKGRGTENHVQHVAPQSQLCAGNQCRVLTCHNRSLVGFLKPYLNKFLLPSAFDGVPNPIIWFLWIPVNSRVSICVFLLHISPDLHGWWCFFSLASARLCYFAYYPAATLPLVHSLTSDLDHLSVGGDSQLLLLSVFSLQSCSEANNKTKRAAAEIIVTFLQI